MISLDVIRVASSVPRFLGTKQCFGRGTWDHVLGRGVLQTLAGTLAVRGAEYLGQPVRAKAERRNGTGLWGPEEHFFGRPPLTLKLRQLVMICVWALRDQKESLEDSDTGVRSGRGY